jgi:hypothetical protein
MDKFAFSTAQKLSDAAYAKYGAKASKLTPSWLLHTLHDPFAFMRSITFNSFLGLGATEQFFVQSASWVNMTAIAPRSTVAGVYGAFLHHLTNFNDTPEILAHLDSLATKIRIPGLHSFRPGEWKEAYTNLKRTGYEYTGSTVAQLDYLRNANVISRGKDRFLSAARSPFTAAEHNNRVGSFYIAHKEFRVKRPHGRITDEDLRSILDRADTLNTNMSRASHSRLNSNAFSLGTQFYNYTIRLAELLWGKRLGETPTGRNLARARVVAVNALMFGAPFGASVTGLPIAGWLREKALDEGYVPGEHPLISMWMEGLPAYLLAQATGNYYDIGPRYASQGFEKIREVLWEDASFWSVLGGASASLVSRTIDNFKAGLGHALGQIVSGDWDNVDIKVEDLVNNFNEVKSISSGQAAWVALNTGKWVNKHYDYISDVSKANVAFMFLSGLRETPDKDIFNKRMVMKDRNLAQRYALKRFSEEMNKSFLAQSQKNYTLAQDYYRRAVSWLPSSDFPPELIGEALGKALKGTYSLVDRTDFEFYIQKAPPSQAEELREAFKYIQQRKGQ